MSLFDANAYGNANRISDHDLSPLDMTFYRIYKTDHYGKHVWEFIFTGIQGIGPWAFGKNYIQRHQLLVQRFNNELHGH